jgi:predicted porin
MKKTLAAVAVLGAFAGSALAADVQLYGVVDLGLNYSHVDMDGNGDDIDSFTMDSGNGSGSRWGIKGTEDLGNGLTVGFILENGFDADTGADGVMFNRESSLFLQGGFGKLALGRMGALNNGQSSWSLIGRLSPFGTSYGDYTAQASNIFSLSSQWDNMIAYQTPDFAGFKVYAQYSMGNAEADHTGTAVENEATADRFYAIGATYDNGPLSAYLAVDSINYASNNGKGTYWGDRQDDSLTVTFGGSYDFEVVKVYLGAQYFDTVTTGSLGGIIANNEAPHDLSNATYTGYSIGLGLDAPLAGGKAMFGVGYVDAEQSDVNEDMGNYYDFTRWVVSAGYSYPFSKRTDVYGVVSYMNDKVEGHTETVTETEWNPSAYSFIVGLRHKF